MSLIASLNSNIKHSCVLQNGTTWKFFYSYNLRCSEARESDARRIDPAISSSATNMDASMGHHYEL